MIAEPIVETLFGGKGFKKLSGSAKSRNLKLSYDKIKHLPQLSDVTAHLMAVNGTPVQASVRSSVSPHDLRISHFPDMQAAQAHADHVRGTGGPFEEADKQLELLRQSAIRRFVDIGFRVTMVQTETSEADSPIQSLQARSYLDTVVKNWSNIARWEQKLKQGLFCRKRFVLTGASKSIPTTCRA